MNQYPPNPNFVKLASLLSISGCLFLVCILSLSINSCKKSQTGSANANLGFAPQYDTLGGTITITGLDFDPSGSTDSVYFSGASPVAAQILSASASQLTVVIPAYAESGPISIKVGANSYTTPNDFLLSPTFYPMSQGIGYLVNIYGNGFSTTPSENLVRFNGTVAVVSVATEHQLTVIVPQHANAGQIVVTTNKRTAPSIANFMPAPGGSVTTLAGSGDPGAVDDLGVAASFNQPYGLCTDSLGNIYVADYGNNKIRKISSTGLVSTLAGNGLSPDADGPLLSASIYAPTSVAIADGDTNRIYVTESVGNRIRFISNDSVNTLVNGNIPAMIYAQPMGLSIDTSGNLFFTNINDSDVVEITAAETINIIAASISPVHGYTAQNIVSLNQPSGTAIDLNGNLYVADMVNNRVLKISSSGTLSTFAGSGEAGAADGQGISAQFNHPTSLITDPVGNVYVVDAGNNEIRRISPDGNVTTLAGSPANSVSTDGSSGAAGFNNPFGIAIDNFGVLYVSELGGNKIRKIRVQ